MDLTILAIPGFFGSMAYEARWLRRRAEREGPSPVDYERSDTIASLVMGTGSLVIPPLAGKLAREFEWGRGRWARPLLAFGVGAAAATAVADAIARSNEREAGSVEATPVEPVGPVETAPVETAPVEPSTRSGGQADRRARIGRFAKRAAGSSAVAAIAATGLDAASTWTARTAAKRLFERRVLPGLGRRPDRSRHRSDRLGLHLLLEPPAPAREPSDVGDPRRAPLAASATTSRPRYASQWADSLGMFVPYGLMSLLGIRPEPDRDGRARST
ncbi:MAG: hypothetical protein V9E94_03945 [Microthrixaceae bacterium]